jgi:carbon monoxide dehydrogenase subunit G
MEMTGEQRIPASQTRVWEALNDPEVLKTCIPGCESIDRISDRDYRVGLTASVGPVRAKFNGKLMLTDIDPPNSYTILFELSGGAAGFGKGNARVTLVPEDAGTKLSYTAIGQVGGKLAQVGSRLIDGVARKITAEFFQRFNETVAGPAPVAPKEEIAITTTQGPWLSGTWAFIISFIVAFVLIWVFR